MYRKNIRNYCINTILIELPPLRERGDDIILLSEFFVRKFASDYNKGNLQISQAALKKLQTHSWPGNIRELEHNIERADYLKKAVQKYIQKKLMLK